MQYYERALQIKEEAVTHRRWFHTNAEVGLDMPKAKAYVMETLRSYGIQPVECGQGVTATIGNGGKVFLLRADMDALPMPEESGLPFACPTGTEAHACGHDLHAAMLLTAAKLLKEDEEKLPGTVKLMFQPAEEPLKGAQNMIDHGVLENPKPDAALAFHVNAGRIPLGIYMYNDTGTMMNSSNGFRITITGKGAHGAFPHHSIDPLNIAVHIYLALEALIAREVDPAKANLLTIGSLHGGSAPNIIPETVTMEGTIRSNDPESRTLLVRRLEEVSKATAQLYGGTAEITMLSDVPPLICDPEFTREIAGYLAQLGNPGSQSYPGVTTSASEDFALVTDKVKGAFILLSAGFLDERGDAPAHNPKVQFNEDVLPIGAAGYAHCAFQWLKNHS